MDTYRDDSSSSGHTNLGKEAGRGGRSGKDVLLVHYAHCLYFLVSSVKLVNCGLGIFMSLPPKDRLMDLEGLFDTAPTVPASRANFL